jgi:hypothetical protein
LSEKSEKIDGEKKVKDFYFDGAKEKDHKKHRRKREAVTTHRLF